MNAAIFVRKPLDLSEVLEQRFADDEASPYVVVKDLLVSKNEYNEFARSMLADRPEWFAGLGGLNKDGVVRVVRIQAVGLPVLLVNPEGANYARYVAVL